MTRREVSAAEAKRIAKRFGVRVPRVGYEMSLGDGRWLASTGHAQFGWFERRCKTPFTVRCRCVPRPHADAVPPAEQAMQVAGSRDPSRNAPRAQP